MGRSYDLGPKTENPGNNKNIHCYKYEGPMICKGSK